MDYGVILMRAQPIHKGHIAVIKQIVSKHERGLVIIGSSNKSGTKRNPLTADFRTLLVTTALASNGLLDKVDIMCLPDWSKEDAYQYAKEWGNFLYYNVVAKIDTKVFTLYYNDDINIVRNWFDETIANRITIMNSDRNNVNISGTKVRDAIVKFDTDALTDMLDGTTLGFLSDMRDSILSAENEDFIM